MSQHWIPVAKPVTVTTATVVEPTRQKRTYSSFNEPPPKLQRTMGTQYAERMSRNTRAYRGYRKYKGYRRYRRPKDSKEVKFRETQYVNEFNTAGTSNTVINALGQGTGPQNRVGNKVTCQGIQVKGTITFDAVGTPNTRGYWAIVLDRQTNAAAPAYNNIFTTVVPGAPFRNLIDSRNRYVILASGTWLTSSIDTPQVAIDTYIPGWRLKGRDRNTYYNAGNANTVADISSNGIFITGVSDSAPGDAPLANIATRFFFTDD